MLKAHALMTGVGLMITLACLVPTAAPAQMPGAGAVEPATATGTRTYGVAALTAHTVGAFQFTGFDATSSANFIANENGSRGCSGPCIYEATVMLPEGALVREMTLAACDTDPDGHILVQFYRMADLENPPIVTRSVLSTGLPQTNGCDVYGTSPFIEPIDNAHNVYGINVSFISPNLPARTLDLRFSAVRLFYQLQVSPAPATATFNDVPTNHPFFAFVEALAAAGVTGGCNVSPPMYCPDAPLTRGQMAVFLGRALGLHFAP